ncbi:copper resistance protein B [Phenylobacterium conjunctum]|uniref:Copper resistance protein B n=1 Tax=Phenylobacterium conjunctum TaxID=1298959 RepID=A0ABW3SYA4_9CAUL
MKALVLAAALVASPALAQTNAPPPVPSDHTADRDFDPAAMARARAVLRQEHGGMRYSQVMADSLEVGDGAYAWEGRAWVGGDLTRAVFKTRGEGAEGERPDTAEVQALWSRAIGPYFDVQAGLRQDLGSGPHRTWALLGTEGLAPYWFDVQGAVFVSDRSEVLARGEGSFDLRITQRLILQPRAELEAAARDSDALGLGAGLTRAEAGLRLRYEVSRRFAPYVGLAWERKLGETASIARAAGEDVGGSRIVVGIRAWN